MIRRLRALRRDGRLRESERVFVAEGLHLVREALDSGAKVELIALSPRLQAGAEGRALLERIRAADAACFEAADSVLDSVQDARSAQPVLAVVRRPRWEPEAGLAPASGGAALLVAVCGVQDPGNLGAIVRAADAAGAGACYVCGATVDPFHPRAVRATMGSLLRLPVLAADAVELRARLRERGVAAVAADPRGETVYSAADLTRPLGLFLGAEGGGLPASLVEACDERLRIPLRAGVESLSVSAAAAVLLFEAARQRTAPA